MVSTAGASAAGIRQRPAGRWRIPAALVLVPYARTYEDIFPVTTRHTPERDRNSPGTDELRRKARHMDNGLIR